MLFLPPALHLVHPTQLLGQELRLDGHFWCCRSKTLKRAPIPVVKSVHLKPKPGQWQKPTPQRFCKHTHTHTPPKAEATCVPSPLPVWKFSTLQPAALAEQTAPCSSDAAYVFLARECQMPSVAAWPPHRPQGTAAGCSPGKQHQAPLLQESQQFTQIKALRIQATRR